jgi:uncharacterized protein with PIN domain
VLSCSYRTIWASKFGPIGLSRRSEPQVTDRMETRCPNCGDPLTDPLEGQSFVPIDIPTIDPSKVCVRCQLGYWLADSGWIAVATLDA